MTDAGSQKSGATPASAKNSCADTQTEIAGSATQNSTRAGLRFFPRSDTISPSSATVTTAGAGPNQSARANTNASEAEIVSGVDFTRIDTVVLNKVKPASSTQ
ncbi:MAG: hypothetical protein QGI10_15780 [Vicinamibacterales bacterium]|nr:hypothetical protein [Vicinamibacterales bacterium]HJN46847.1 hypothetical protein [Vicinamibacterales bacterium]